MTDTSGASPSRGAGKRVWLADLLASLVVFLVALPLCIGIAVACGVPPERGLVTGIVGGTAVGLISGAPLLVSGPAASLIVPVFDLIERYGLVALAPVVVLAGVWQALAGVLRLGRWFRAVAPAVVHGMLIGIGVLIFASQSHVAVDGDPSSSFVRNVLTFPAVVARGFALGAEGLVPLFVGGGTLVILASWTRFRPKRLALVPGHLVALVVATGVVAWLRLHVRHLEIAPRFFDGLAPLAFADLSMLLDPSLVGLSLVFAFVGSAATLLTATAIDQRQSHSRADYDREMLAQGVGNIVAGALGGLPMTGVVVRSSVNVDAGAQTRLSTVLHGVWLAGFVVVAPKLLELIPRATLGAVLVYTGARLVDVGALRELYRRGWHELTICLITLGGVVFIDLLTGILAGFGAALLKVVYTFTHLEVRSVADPHHRIQHIHLVGSATFLRLPRLALALEAVPADRCIELHIDQLDHIDHACLELLSAWRKQRASEEAPGMEVEWSELGERYEAALWGGRKVGIVPAPLLRAVWEDWQELYRRQGRDTTGRALPDDWVDAQRAHARLRAAKLTDVASRAAVLLAKHIGVVAEEIQEALEDLPQTTLPLAHQVAVLHARMTGLPEPVVAVITTEAPLTVGDTVADLFFVLLAPIEEPQRHLHALARVSQICRADADVVSQLRAARTPSDLVQAIGQVSPGALPRPLDEEDSSLVVVLELEDDRSARTMADLVNIAFRRPIHLTPEAGSIFELFRSAARANPIHHLVVFNVGQADLGVLRALLDQQATLTPGTLCKLCLLEGS